MEIKREDINEILMALEDSYFDELDECSFYDNVVNPFKKKYKKTFSYDSGATKGVFIFNNLDYVIKIPFCYTGDEEAFCGAEDNGDGWNYCEVEEIKYQSAKTFGVESCFAETICIGEVNGHPIYAQERAKVYTNDGSPSPIKTNEEYEKVENMCEKFHECFNRVWLSDALDYFGEKIFYKLLEFINACEISDLHDGNIGYIGMRPVLIDYSSYND